MGHSSDNSPGRCHPRIIIPAGPAGLVSEKRCNRRCATGSGLTALSVEQNVEVALSISKHAHVLQLGQIVLGGSREELLADKPVKAIYLS